MDSRADDIISSLALIPHPEGGHYREFFRSGGAVVPRDGRGERAALSAIFFLLRANDASRWHAIRSDEQWTLLEGGPLELLVLDRASLMLTTHRLGARAQGGVATVVVPGGSWQAAQPQGSHALVTCTVGPGFDFTDFEFMADDVDATAWLRQHAPALARFL